ncbi:isocitrate/isopropylmalate dehydrogenase family protein [Paenibacillus hodogayensis]|uniref:Isocitrate/isopropylmalate dehydrogenase family protein n=1 Tax=Paenibacillus hodogayensis TaxID=279208 RepID=A0ABV5VTS3_9BACL
MGAYAIGLLSGDGIGPEITASVVEVLGAAQRHSGSALLRWVRLPMGQTAIARYGEALPAFVKETLRECSGWIMGPHDSASYPPELRHERNPSAELRHGFDLYANIRPNRSIAGIASVARQADLVIVRENTEGFYADRNLFGGDGEWHVTPDVVVTAGVFTRKASERIAHAAFREAVRRRKLVSIVHKANVIKRGYGLFLDCCYEVARQYPEVRVNDYHIDAASALLVRRAEEFDVIVTTNLFGDILSDLAGELVGSIGLAPSLNAGSDYAMAQAAHGSAPDIAGRNAANPAGLLLSAALLLDWLGDRHADRRLRELGDVTERAVYAAIRDGVRTADLGGTATTAEFTAAVTARLGES